MNLKNKIMLYRSTCSSLSKYKGIQNFILQGVKFMERGQCEDKGRTTDVNDASAVLILF